MLRKMRDLYNVEGRHRTCQKMNTITLLIIICTALLTNGIQGLENPGTSELLRYYGGVMQFSWETISRSDEYVIRGTTYYSERKGLYRFDANNGANQLFIFPRDGEAFYYFHRTVGEHKTRSCYKMSFRPYDEFFSPSPIPRRDSLDRGYREEESVIHHGEWLSKYVKNTLPTGPDGSPMFYVQRELFFTNQNNVSPFPVRSEYKKWITDSHHRLNRLYTHEVTDYYSFSWDASEQMVFTLPFYEICQQVSPDDPRGVSISSHAGVIHVPEELKWALEGKRDRSVRYRYASSVEDDAVFPDTQNHEYNQQDLPLSWDWRNYGAVTSVKNQRDCGGCWAFGAVAALESAYFLKYNQSVVLSEQFLIDCSWFLENEGCAQGSHDLAFQWIQQHGGIPLTERYGPFINMNGNCNWLTRNELYGQILKREYIITNNTYDLKHRLVNYGPIVVHIDSEPMLKYTSGILTDCNVQKRNHFVLLVGYGETRNREPYWIVKNSWGNSWGMDGYALLSAKPGENCLGILDRPISITLQ